MNIRCVMLAAFVVAMILATPLRAETCTNGKVCPAGTTCGPAGLFCKDASGRVDRRLPTGPSKSDPSPGQGIDATQCIKVYAGKDARTWRVHNECTYGVNTVIAVGSQGTRDSYFIGNQTYVGVISSTTPGVVSACAKGAPDCR